MREWFGVGKSTGSLAVTGFLLGEDSAIRLANWSLYCWAYDSRGINAASGKRMFLFVEWKQLVAHLRTLVQSELRWLKEAAFGVNTALPYNMEGRMTA